MQPMTVSVINIYAFCNIHDVSWGNRPTTGQEMATVDAAKKEKLKQEYMVYRGKFLLVWMMTNFIFSLLCPDLIL
jgi:hypothetical protein